MLNSYIKAEGVSNIGFKLVQGDTWCEIACLINVSKQVCKNLGRNEMIQWSQVVCRLRKPMVCVAQTQRAEGRERLKWPGRLSINRTSKVKSRATCTNDEERQKGPKKIDKTTKMGGRNDRARGGCEREGSGTGQRPERATGRVQTERALQEQVITAEEPISQKQWGSG